MPAATELEVVSTETLTPAMVRVRFRGGDLAAFADSAFTDRYVKLQLGTAAAPVVRTYTVLDPDVAARTLAIDFVVHGDEGHAGPWAASARPGDRLTVRGPGGAYAPDPTADWHLLAGDAAALPAIRAAVVALPSHAVGEVVLDVPGPDHQQPLPAPPAVRVTWVHGGLEDAVRAAPWRPGRVHAFVHGEAHTVMHGLRPYLLAERGVRRADASVSGYWRAGRTEEAFRVWKRELAEAESTG